MPRLYPWWILSQLRTSMLNARVFPTYKKKKKKKKKKIWSESFEFELSAAYTCSLKPTLSCLIINGLRNTGLTLLLALVAIVFTPNNVRTISIFIVILHWYTRDMMQIFDDDYVTLIPFSRSFEYNSGHAIIFGLLNIVSPLTQLPAYTYSVNGQHKSMLWSICRVKGVGNILLFLKKCSTPFVHFWPMYRCINSCLDDAQAQ